MLQLHRLLAPLLLLIATGCSGLFPAFPGRGPVPQGVADPAVRVGTLENGLTYFIRANREPAARAELRLVVNAGSVLEDDDQRGLAHLVEHMAFNGTANFEQQEIVEFLESVGMRFGPDVNAYTSFDETVFMLTVPTDRSGILETAVQILEEWAWQISFDSVQVEQERAVVIEEWRLGQGAGSRLQDRQFPTLTQRSRYAERLPIGTYQSLTTFDHATLRRFYDDWYRPDLMAVVAVGDFDAEEVERLIRDHFSRVPPKPEARRRREFEVPRHRETLVSVATDPELTASSVNLYLKRRPRRERGTAGYQRWVIESLTSAMLVNRLSELTQRRDSPFLDVSSFQGRFVRTLSTFVLSARARDDAIEQALEDLLLEVERAAQHGFTTTELEREKREMLRVMEQRYAERHKTTSSSFAADYVSHYLYGGIVLDTDREYELYRELIPKVRLKDAHSVAREWTGAANRVLLISTPQREGHPAPREEALQRIVQRAPRRDLVAYRDSLSEAPLLRELPEPGEILAERALPEIGAFIWELDNGSRLILKPTDFREEEILFAGRSPGGTSLVEDSDYIPALTAAAVVQAGGLGELSANDLRKRLAGSVAGVGVDIGELYEGVSGAASPRDLETLFQLIYLKFTAPRPDSAAFLAYQSQARASLSNRSASPDMAFQDTLRVILAQNHPRARPPSAEIFDELDMERSFEIYRDRFADASDFTFFLVGSFDPDEVRGYVRQYLASLPALGRNEAGQDVGIRPPAGIVRKTVRRGLEPRGAVQIVFTGDFEFARANVLTLQTLADVLRIRLRETLREDLGGTYGVSVRGSASAEPVPQFQFSIGFGADPERIDELTGALFQEIERLRVDGPQPEELEKVAEMQFRSRETELRQNHFWLGQLMVYAQNGWDLDSMPTVAAPGVRVDASEIRRAAERYLDPANYIQVTLLPEQSSNAAPGRPGEPLN